MTENTFYSLSFFLFYSIIFTFSNFFFFDLNIKFGKTKQKVITLVATTLKSLLAVTKTNGRFSLRKLNTCNVYTLFLNIFIHIFPHQHIINIHPHSGGDFSFGHSPNTTGCAQVRRVLVCQPCNCYLLPVNGSPKSLPPRGRCRACEAEGACDTLVFISPYCNRSMFLNAFSPSHLR